MHYRAYQQASSACEQAHRLLRAEEVFPQASAKAAVRLQSDAPAKQAAVDFPATYLHRQVAEVTEEDFNFWAVRVAAA